MSANGINLNGQSTNVPGPYALVTYSTAAGTSVPLEILALMDNLPFLEQNVPYTVSSAVSMKKLQPYNQELLTCADIIYAAASDDRVAGAPASVVLCNVQPNTQAFVNVLDGSGNPTVVISSRAWGSIGNQTRVTVGLSGGVYTVTITRNGVTETYTNIEPIDLFTLQYIGGDFATVSSGVKPQTTVNSGATLPQTTITVVSTAAFPIRGNVLIESDEGWQTITYTGKTSTTFTGCSGGTGDISVGGVVKPESDSVFWIGASGSEPIGTQAYGIMWTGPVRAAPSAPSGGVNTYTVTVTGIDEETGEASTEQLGWVNADGTAAKTTVANWSYLTSIQFAESGAVTPTFTVTGDIMRTDASDFASVGALADYLAIDTTNFTTSDINGLANSLGLADMDPLGPTNITSGAHTYSNAQMALVNGISASALVEAEAVEDGGAPVALSATYMQGGSQSSTGTSDWQAGFTALRQVPCSIVVPMTDNATVHGYLKDHCTYMAGPGRNPRNGYVGAAANETLAQLKTRAQNLNSRNVSLVGQEIRRANPSGNLTWYAPKYLALLAASMQAGTTGAITYKVPNIVDYRQSSTWNPIDDAQECINNMLTIVGELVVGQTVPLTRIIRGLTTYLISSDPARTDIQPNKSLNQLCNFALASLVEQVGEPTSVPTEVLNRIWLGILQSAVTLGIIAAFDPRTVTTQRVANVVLFGATVRPAYSQDFLVVNVNVAPESVANGGGFTLSLAA